MKKSVTLILGIEELGEAIASYCRIKAGYHKSKATITITLLGEETPGVSRVTVVLSEPE